MGKNLLSRREVMIICKSIFDFKANGIKPLLKDIKLCNAWRFLEYYFYDDLGDEYFVKFYIKEAKEVSFYVYKCSDKDTFDCVCCERYYIDLHEWSLYPFRKVCGLYCQSQFSDDDIVYLEK